MAPTKVLTGARVVLPTGTVDDARVTVEGTRIAATEPGTSPAEGTAGTVDLRGHWLVPGFVDIHNHGGGGVSFAGGTAEDVLQGVRTHLRHGTTTVVASAVTGDLDFLARHAGMLAELAQQGDIAGIHFEGPFISPAARAPTTRRCCATPTRRRSAS